MCSAPGQGIVQSLQLGWCRMGNQFTGIQDSGNRRRRRLSQDEQPDAFDNGLMGKVPSGLSSSQTWQQEFPQSADLLQRFVSRRLWKQLVFLFIMMMVVAGAVLWTRAARPSSAADFRLVHGLTGLLFLLAGQLALAVGWVRSQSSIDFRGRYRWWKWLGLSSIIYGVAIITNLHIFIPDVMAFAVEPFTGPVSAARQTLVIVPGLLLCIIVLGRVIPDMSRSVWSQGCLVAAVLVMTIRLMLSFTSSRAVIADASLSHIQLIASFAGFAAMTLHCRFVAFVNNDPPVRSEGPSELRDESANAEAATSIPEHQLTEEPVEKSVAVDEQTPSEPPRKKSNRQRRRKAA